MSIRTKTTQAIQKAGQALFEANAAIAKAFQEQREYVSAMDVHALTSPDASAGFQDMMTIAALAKDMMAIEDSLKAVYAKSVALASPANTVLLGSAKLQSTHRDPTASDVQVKEPKKRGRKPKAAATPMPVPAEPKKRGPKPKVTLAADTQTAGAALDIVNAKSKPRKPLAIKFRGPNGEAWTGRGSTPLWLKALEAQGKPRTEFLAKA